MIEGSLRFSSVFTSCSAVGELEASGFGARRLKINWNASEVMMSQDGISQVNERATTTKDSLLLLDEEVDRTVIYFVADGLGF
jgi:hypothetical protein